MKYKFLSHTADIKFQAFGNSLEEAFENSFEALKQVIVDKTKIKNKKTITIKVKGNDLKELLYNFLEETLFLLDAKDFIVGEIKNIKIDKDKFQLTGEVVVDMASDYKISNDVKAITYNDMEIVSPSKNGVSQTKYKNKFVIQVVLDV